MAQPTTHDDEALERELAGLRRQYEALREQKVRLEQDLAHLEAQMRELSEQAVAEYGTADPAALEALLTEKRQENARIVQRYREHLETIRAGLEALEKGA